MKCIKCRESAHRPVYVCERCQDYYVQKKCIKCGSPKAEFLSYVCENHVSNNCTKCGYAIANVQGKLCKKCV